MISLVNRLHRLKHKPEFIFITYLTVISSSGAALILWSMAQVPAYESPLIFLLLLALAALTTIVTTSMPVGESSITYHIGSAISISAVPLFGTSGAVLIAGLQVLVGWLLKPTDQKTWKKTGRQLAFNLGMDVLSIYVAGMVLDWVRRWLGATPLWGVSLLWLLAALVYAEVNLWILIGVLRLQQGPRIRVWEMWREDRWATQIDVLLMTIGGGLLAFAIDHYDWLGVVMFFLPIGLSAYAFRLYVRQMQAHLNNLEQLIGERTHELSQRTQELSELNQQKDAFLSVLSHDMMTPLANIRFSAEMICEDAASPSENKHLAQLMLHSQATLHNMVRNILDLAKLPAVGTLPMRKAPFDLNKLLLQVLQIMQGEASEKEIYLAYQCHSPTLWLNADAAQLERVFMNLLSNALKYTPDQGKVTVIAQLNAHQQVEVDVVDNGYGIPTEEIPHLFERFRRIKQLEGKASGTGLGLAITKALIEQHGGEITVTSKVALGSKFTVILPVA